MQDSIVVEKGVYVHRYEHGTVTVTAPRDITLQEWEEPLQRFLAKHEQRKGEKKDAA